MMIRRRDSLVIGSLLFNNDEIPWFESNCLLRRNRSLGQQIGTSAPRIYERLWVAGVIEIIVDCLSASIYPVLDAHRCRKLLIRADEPSHIQYIQQYLLLQLIAENRTFVGQSSRSKVVSCDCGIFSEKAMVVVSKGLGCVHDEHFRPLRDFV